MHDALLTLFELVVRCVHHLHQRPEVNVVGVLVMVAMVMTMVVMIVMVMAMAIA